tara:strand:- start:355 stop:690 length:336 start_codon:yes stop_codon:yes gene_type:complete
MATFSYTPSFPALEQSAPIVRTVVFGEGFQQRLQFGLNRDPKNWSLTFANRDDTERDNIITFLEARSGTESFDWTPPRGSAGKFLCRAWATDMAIHGRTTINATFEEVFEP